MSVVEINLRSMATAAVAEAAAESARANEARAERRRRSRMVILSDEIRRVLAVEIDQTWITWRPGLYQSDQEPLVTIDGLVFTLDADSRLLARAPRPGCEHFKSEHVTATRPLVVIGTLLERAQTEPCSECQWEALQAEAIVTPLAAAPQPALSARLEQLIREIVRDELRRMDDDE